MAVQLELHSAPPLRLSPECVVYSGHARLFRTAMVMIQTSSAPGEQFGFFLPEVPALTAGTAEPQLWAEASLMTAIATSTSGSFPFGVEKVHAAYVPDPRGGSDRWLNLSGTAHIGREIRIGYRVTVQST
ncbi:hypothetical protein [Nocardia goodfellowii]|uniref:Uncharacterized protein n=1 Tax=Nocardia goodfellowii TaxID=882446 RepID=A0ABS4QKG9_9NOCA|nr:hypothetical protein [Nocardia goodfellowii]MBP2192058.1 hypothetical protein [Nocardia goodfellowii]